MEYKETFPIGVKFVTANDRHNGPICLEISISVNKVNKSGSRMALLLENKHKNNETTRSFSEKAKR